MSPQDLDRAIEAAGRGREYDLPPLALRRGDFSFLQLFSHLFVHGDLLHLAGNMIFLFVFGNAVNAKLGHALFLASYFLLGAIAGAAWLLLSGGPALVGASGAIMGLVGVFLVFFPRNDVRVYYMFTLAWTGAFSISSCWLILFYLACDIVGTVYGHGGIAYIAHVVGGLGGMALAIGLLAGGWLESDPGEENLLQVLGMQEKEKTYNERVSQAKKALKKKKRG